MILKTLVLLKGKWRRLQRILSPKREQGLSAELNPLTYTTDIFRAGLFDAPTPLLPLEMTVLAVEAAVMFTIAVFAFRRIKV